MATSGNEMDLGGGLEGGSEVARAARGGGSGLEAPLLRGTLLLSPCLSPSSGRLRLPVPPGCLWLLCAHFLGKGALPFLR